MKMLVLNIFNFFWCLGWGTWSGAKLVNHLHNGNVKMAIFQGVLITIFAIMFVIACVRFPVAFEMARDERQLKYK